MINSNYERKELSFMLNSKVKEVMNRSFAPFVLP